MVTAASRDGKELLAPRAIKQHRAFTNAQHDATRMATAVVS
jgi:hypothetical protein